MQALTRTDLMSLEQYAAERTAFRARVLEHKRNRQLAIGPHVTLYFEDRLTIQYQIQEMLRIERIFEAAGIEEELSAYNPLIPDGRNWKATMMVEYDDAEERRQALTELVGIEDQVWIRIGEHPRVNPIADEDLERSKADKTSAVHFLRFELTTDMIADLKQGALLSAGVDHRNYQYTVMPVAAAISKTLTRDLD